jgi:hypothetical protein
VRHQVGTAATSPPLALLLPNNVLSGRLTRERL